MKKLFIILFAILIISCAPTVQQKPKILDSKQINSPALNAKVTTEIGQTMVEKGYEYLEKAIRLDSLPVSKSLKLKTLKAGDILPYVTTYAGNDLYYNSSFEGISVNEKSGKADFYTAEGVRHIVGSKQKIFYTQTTVTKRSEAGFKQQYIYNGKSGNTIKFTYREFNGDMARPAFTQDLQYDLSESNIIGFKELRIEVLKATNIDIEYKVLKSFGS